MGVTLCSQVISALATSPWGEGCENRIAGVRNSVKFLENEVLLLDGAPAALTQLCEQGWDGQGRAAMVSCGCLSLLCVHLALLDCVKLTFYL